MSCLKNFLTKKMKPENDNHQKIWNASISANSMAGRSTNSIDNQIQKKADVQNKTLNILLLGAGGSGKSTIMKQMERIYDKGIA